MSRSRVTSDRAGLKSALDRRGFLRLGGCALTAPLSVASGPATITAARAEPSWRSHQPSRAAQAYAIRHEAALRHKEARWSPQEANGDEERHATKLANYSKALPHTPLGEVEPDAYAWLTRAIATGRHEDFERVPRGGSLKQVNPQGALAFDLEGGDAHQFRIPAPPTFESTETAAEMVELYWQAMARDVPFVYYDEHPWTRAAATELSGLSHFTGPRAADAVSTQTLFRDAATGAVAGPYISQFLLKDVPYGATPIVQRIAPTAAGIDYLTVYSEWLSVQDGGEGRRLRTDPGTVYIHNGRELAEYVHRDFTYQHFLNACLILQGVAEAAADSGDPYRHAIGQSGFCTFGAPHVLDLTARAANCALKAAWYQKWCAHRRLRPEECGGRVHHHLSGFAGYPIHSELLDARALKEVFARYKTYLLPTSYPEGAPAHPAYPAGHAAIAGACVTVLKAFFDEAGLVPRPVQPTDDGTELEPYRGATLTIGGELDKLASNVAFGRNFAGIHWRSDSAQGLRLGEQVALSVLADMKRCFNEPFAGFSLTTFDGTTIVV